LKDFDESYINFLKNLINNTNLRLAMGKNAAKKSRKEFDPERFVKDHLNLFKRAL
jgi:glycosyltransferase involved in cell wall biosynthesis